MKPNALERYRKRIARLDRQLVALLRKRSLLVRRIWAAKRALGLPLLDPAQEAAVLGRARRWGREQGVSAELVDKLFPLLLEEGKRSAREKAPVRGKTALRPKDRGR